jgi:2-dehydro-3-deoxygalactonokinase
LLIGSDIRHGLDQALPVAVMGRPALTELYARAFSLAGRTVPCIDGAKAFLAGIRLVVGQL